MHIKLFSGVKGHRVMLTETSDWTAPATGAPTGARGSETFGDWENRGVE
jgi:hypothetical protein